MMQHWGNAGLDKHLKGIQAQYRRRARLMHEAAQKVRNHQAAPADILAVLSSWLTHSLLLQHLKGLAEWKAPGETGS